MCESNSKNWKYMKEFFFKKQKQGSKRTVTLFNLFSFTYIRKSSTLQQRYCIYNKKLIHDINGIDYIGNQEYGLLDLDARLEQEEFEWQDMIATNIAIGEIFLKNVKTVVNIGCGVGTFEHHNAPKFTQIHFVASEFSATSLEWAKSNRNMPNVDYCSLPMDDILQKYGKFDIAVSIDVIEHISNYKAFLDDFVKLASKAVITTPNRDRCYKKIYLERPPSGKHVLEFNAGEFYFILKMYYKKVTLFSHKDPYDTELIRVGIYSCRDKLIALCEN